MISDKLERIVTFGKIRTNSKKLLFEFGQNRMECCSNSDKLERNSVRIRTNSTKLLDFGQNQAIEFGQIRIIVCSILSEIKKMSPYLFEIAEIQIPDNKPFMFLLLTAKQMRY